MYKLIALISILLSSLFFTACDDKKEEEIKIGFVAGLSGKYSSLGTSIRDGFVLAFDEIDHTINNKQIKIIQKDDKQDKKEAKKIIDSFIKQEIKLIVGNATSSMTAISLPIVNKQKDMLLISATSSSDDFSFKDDNFLRIQVEHSVKRYKNLSQYAAKNGYKNIFFIYDSKNYKYASGYENIFQKTFIESGGNKFVGKADLNGDYKDIIKQLKEIKYDLILIVGNSLDSANIIQYIRHNKINTQILGSGWAKTMDFIENGGRAVEGVIFSTGYDDKSKDKKFLEFIERFKNKYNKTPSVFAAQGYELGQILIKELKQSSDISNLKQRILKTKKFEGLQGDIIFDKYGDVFREYFIMEVKNKEYIEFGPEHEAVSITRYKEMVEELVLELTEQNPILKRIKDGEDVSSDDANELAELLQKERPHITEDLLRTVYQNRKARFIQFIRHILQIEILKSFPETVTEAFDQFIQQHTNLTSKQLDFLNLLKNFITEREKVVKKDLIRAPFTVIHPQGILGVFNSTEITDILALTEQLAA